MQFLRRPGRSTRRTETVTARETPELLRRRPHDRRLPVCQRWGSRQCVRTAGRHPRLQPLDVLPPVGGGVDHLLYPRRHRVLLSPARSSPTRAGDLELEAWRDQAQAKPATRHTPATAHKPPTTHRHSPPHPHRRHHLRHKSATLLKAAAASTVAKGSYFVHLEGLDGNSTVATGTGGVDTTHPAGGWRSRCRRWGSSA